MIEQDVFQNNNDSRDSSYDFISSLKSLHADRKSTVDYSSYQTKMVPSVSKTESSSFQSSSELTSTYEACDVILRPSNEYDKPSVVSEFTTNIDTNTIKVHSSSKKGADPYADVRERMNALSLASRMRHVYHNLDNTENLKHVSHFNNDVTIPYFAALTTYLGYSILILVGRIRDVCATVFQRGRYLPEKSSSCTHNFLCSSDDYRSHAALLKSWDNFFTKRLYHRIQDCFNRPLASSPGAHIRVLERISNDGNKSLDILGQLDNLASTFEKNIYLEGHYYDTVSGDRVVRKCLNLGSYNYLGFADDWDITCRSGVMSSLKNLPLSTSSSRLECGTTSLHKELERLIAEYIGKEDAMILNMGFNTNATTIPALMGSGDLIVSDELNHTSIVNGARNSGAAIRCFHHDDFLHLESILREAIIMGRPRSRRPWNKILVVIEGIYSMEGEYCDLRNIVKVCKKYGAYLYLDEAHSIGAMGSTGRGCCEYTGVDPKDVDVLMGTFTKSFGGMGGYIAASMDVIDALRVHCAASSYHNSMSPIVCQQIISSLKIIMGKDGTHIGNEKIIALRDNSNYVRMRLSDMGLHVLGYYDSPIIPVMIYNPTKLAAFSRECFKRGIAVVVVGFPAVPILMCRVRFCISAGHNRQDLDRALDYIDEIADILKIRYTRSIFG